LSTKIKPKANEIEWRRTKVVEMRARGVSQAEIAHELQVSEASISLDMQYLRSQAKESIKEYVTEHLPEQYQVCLCALDTILKNAFEILQTTDDNREKLQAMEMFKDTHLVKLELMSNATTIDHALEYIRNKQQSDSSSQKKPAKQEIVRIGHCAECTNNISDGSCKSTNLRNGIELCISCIRAKQIIPVKIQKLRK
jgi:IS30 family transposase